MKKIAVEEIRENPWTLVGQDWMLVAAQKKDGRVNAMTASWGGVGILWGVTVVLFAAAAAVAL